MADEKKSTGKSKALTQLEKDVYETFGMLPNEDRLTLLPRYKKGEGFIAPEMLYELAKAVQSPRTAMYSELGPEEAINMGLNVMGGSSVASAPRGALRMGIARPTLEPERRAALMEAERALPLNLPRAPAKSKQEIAAHAERVGRQMLGEHVRTGKPKDAQNLAGRSMKESQRLQKLQYELEPIKTLPPLTTVQPRIGDINVAVPGDASISDILLKSIEGEPIGSVQQGGSLYGLGKLDRDDPLFWASNEGPAQQMQDKITDLAALFDPERVLAQHLAMGRVANNFAQHFADASLRAIDYSKLSAKDMNTFDNVIAGGYTKKDKKTGEVKRITFPNWPGIADPEGALAAMKSDPEMRKWFLSRMKTRKLTKATNMPNALDIEWAITHPELRNMEVNLTGHSVGEMVPGAKLADDPDHETYLKGIRGTFLGQQENLTPFAISYPDAAQHVASTQRPQDFTGTIQKVFPHQRVDQQYLDEYYEYMRQLQKMLTGRKKGGAVEEVEGGLAPYGLRHSGEGVKGKGYFGLLPNKMDGVSTEISVEDETGEYPLIVPTLTAEELDRLLAGGDPTPEMLDKASSWAATRRKRGESPFASPTEVRMPRPKAEGGSVSLTDLPDEVNPSNWREHLQNNVRADARALLGAKDGGVINLDDLIEKSLEKKDGGVINLDELIDWTLAKAEHRKMKEGGAVKMQGGGNPGEVAGDMFKPKPLSIPEPITSFVEALRRQFEKEKRSMSKPGAAQDVLMRGPVAAYAGAPADILGMGGELLDYAQKKIPALRKPASVMDTGPEKVPPMGYAPMFPLSPEGSYGTTAAQELMGKAGLTTGEERPLFEIGSAVAAPFATYGAVKAGKALAPTATDFLDLQLGNLMKPYQMSVVPEGGPKLSKEEYSRMMREKYAAQNLAKQEKPSLKAEEVKAPADDLGLYSPAEKAALNLKRNIGTGEAFLSDLRKAPDVGEADLLHAGLEDWLKSKKTVSKQEIQDYMNANRVRMRQRELSGEGVSEDMQFGRPETVDDYEYIQSVADDYVYDWDNFGYKTRDEIKDEILSSYSPEEADDLIASGKIDDLVEEEIGNLANDLAHDQYYDNPYRRWSNNAGYEIIGNDDVGYSVRSPNGDVVNRRDVYDFETAEGIAQSHGMDQGYGGAGSTQYSEYQLAGPSSNYREHLTQIDRTTQRSMRENELNDLARQMNQATDPIEKDRLLNEYNRLKEDVYEIYSGAHHDYEDIMSHSRTQDRVSDEGKNILHVDELQSDMHQDGAEFGYKTPELRQRYKTLMNERKALADEFGEARDRLQELIDARDRAAYRMSTDINNLPLQKEYEAAKARADQLAAKIDGFNKEMSDIEKAVPDAPFKKDWAEKEFKKLLTLAAKEGKDGITLSRWQDQLERWGTDSLAFRKTKTGEWVISGSKYRPLSKADLDDTITPKEVAEILFAREGEYDCNSKEGLRFFVERNIARGWSNAHIDRVTNKAWEQMQNLKPGEMAAIDPRKDGFKATYGKAYVEMMQKMARKYGGKMTTAKIDKGDEIIEVPYIEISGNLLKSAKKGFPYKKGGAVSKADLEREYRMAFGGGVFNTDPDITDSGRIIPEHTI